MKTLSKKQFLQLTLEEVIKLDIENKYELLNEILVEHNLISKPIEQPVNKPKFMDIVKSFTNNLH